MKKYFFIGAALVASTLLLSVGCTKKEETKTENTQAAIQKVPEIKDLLMQEVAVGKGKEIKDGDTAVVQYRGTFLDGKEFDSSYSRNKPFEFKLGAKQVIDGWDIGVKGMKVGGKRLLVVPPQMAYGSEGNGPVPPNTPLKFEVELVAIKDGAQKSKTK
mgnify:CR=1 FL=1